MLQYALQDDYIVKAFGKKLQQLKLNTTTYIALHAAMVGESKVAFRYLLKGIGIKPSAAFSKRVAATIKFILFR